MEVNQKLIDDMKKLTLLTGRLSELQEVNLKQFPFVFFDKLTKVSMHYDIMTNDAAPGVGSTVRYELEFEEGYTPELVSQRVEALNKSVKFILWNDVKVFVFNKGLELS